MYQILRALGFEPTLYLDYHDEDHDVLFHTEPHISGDWIGTETLIQYFQADPYCGGTTEQVTWVTPRTTTNTVKRPYVFGDHESEVIGWAYGHLCLILRIGSLDDRLEYATHNRPLQ